MNIIGQAKLIQDLKSSKARSMLIQGPAHSGKKSIIRQVFHELGLYVYEVSGTVTEFRDTIEFIRTQTNPIMYLIPDVDTLHAGIQNLLLKILEEPPMKARFCLTASNAILPTIKSRCVCYSVERYTSDEMIQAQPDNLKAVIQRCPVKLTDWVDSPGQLSLLANLGLTDVLQNLVVQMSDIKSSLDQPLAVVMNKANILMKYVKENSVGLYVWFLIARGLYSDYSSYLILSKNLKELDRYIICYFYAELWKEVACT